MVASGLWAQQEGGGTIYGRVTAARSQPPQQLLVRLYSSGEIPAGECYTDSNGGYIFHTLPNGTYYVVVQAEGYRPARQSALLDMRLQPKVQVNIDLEPLRSEAKQPSPVIRGSSSSYKLSAGGRSVPIDPRALREFDKGNRDQQKGNFRGAIAHYQKALHIEPHCYAALNNLGAIYLRQNQTSQAKETFVKLLRFNPEDSEGYINLGHALYLEGQYRQAVGPLEE